MSTPESSTNRRSKYVLDPRWQLSVSFGVAGLALGAGLLYLLGTYFLASKDALESLSGSQTAFLALVVNALYFLILAGLLFVIVLRITHAVVGPARVLKTAVEGMRIGRFDCRLTLRKGDYLKDLASSLQHLSADLERQQTDLERQQTERERACRGLEQAVSQGDQETVRKLLAELRAAPSPAPMPRPSAGRSAA
jgi:hypothetical protein